MRAGGPQVSLGLSSLTDVDTAATSSDFRDIVLRGANVASYKFALANSILTLAESGATEASLEDLAVPFSSEVCTHLAQVDTQATSAGSRFLDACRHFNAGRITSTELVETTALQGFKNVRSGRIRTLCNRTAAGSWRNRASVLVMSFPVKPDSHKRATHTDPPFIAVTFGHAPSGRRSWWSDGARAIADSRQVARW